MSVHFIQADARHVPLASGSIHFAMTSPPYYALRSYLAKDDPLKPREIGMEQTPAQYIAAMMQVCDEVNRVLRDDGVFVVNIADSYVSTPPGCGKDGVSRSSTLHGHISEAYRETLRPSVGQKMDTSKIEGLKQLDQIGIPFLFAFAMRERGWYWRDTVIWRKKSAMPASLNGWRWQRCKRKVRNGERSTEKKGVTTEGRPHASRHENGKDFVNTAEYADCPGCAKCSPNGGYVLRRGALRTTTGHEYLFIFTKSSTYYGDREGWATPAKSGTHARNKYSRVMDDPDEQFAVRHDHEFTGATANLRSVITVGHEPLKASHYAAYPHKLCVPFIKAFTSEKGCCPTCGAPWARVVESTQVHASGSGRAGNLSDGKNGRLQGFGITGGDVRSGPIAVTDTLGWRPTCACPLHLPRPCRVFDPFNGSGRTGIAADRLGRDYIGTELNAKYVHVAVEQLERDREKRKHNGKPRRARKVVTSEPSLFAEAS